MGMSKEQKDEAKRRLEEYNRGLREQDVKSNPRSTEASRPGIGSQPISGGGNSGSGSAGSRLQYDTSSGSSSKDNRFKGYVPTEVRAKKGGWNFFNGGGGGGGGGGSSGGGAGAFVAPHSTKGRSISVCDSGYGSTSSSGSNSNVGRRSGFNLGSTPNNSTDSRRTNSGGGGIASLGGFNQPHSNNNDRNRHPASSGSGSSGHRPLGRSVSESSAGSSGSAYGMNLSAIYEKEFGKDKKK